MTKTCPKCKTEKDLSRFSKNKNNKDGRQCWCKNCSKIALRKIYRDNLGKYKKYREEYKSKEGYKEIQKKSNIKYLKANRHKRKAHKAVAYAIEKGRLIKKPCETCGEISSHAHHDDYSKLLEVKWLCAEHHKFIHRKTA